MTMPDRRDSEYMAGLEKGLAIIEVFENASERLSLTEVAKAVGLTRASARRCLRTLEHLGYAAYDGKYYRLAPRILRLGHAYMSSNILTKIVQPVIEATSEGTGESMAVAVLDGTSAVVIARTSVRKSLSSGLAAGSRLPVYCSATGRMLLSDLAEAEAKAILDRCVRSKLTPNTKTDRREILREIAAARAQGHAINDQEVEVGLRTVAVPIHDQTGTMVAAMSISAQTSRVPLKSLLSTLLPEISAARNRVTSLLHA
jgi:IclR family pca regulon transcriptional regulator